VAFILKSAPMFRIFNKSARLVIDVNTAAEIEAAIRARPPGLYVVDEMPLKPFSSGRTARRWGIGIKWADGSVLIEPDRWDA
jgi:hypothetical protein